MNMMYVYTYVPLGDSQQEYKCASPTPSSPEGGRVALQEEGSGNSPNQYPTCQPFLHVPIHVYIEYNDHTIRFLARLTDE